jgi:hypothetical protein
VRGGFLHQQLIDPIAHHFGATPGARVHREHAAGPTIHHGAVDLIIEYLHHRIVIEAELTTRRVLRDIEKALSLQATHLLIVTPTARSAQAARHRIVAGGPIRVPDVLWVYPFGLAIARLELHFPVCGPTTGRTQEATS